MLSINTNPQSLVAQKSLKNSTLKLNMAIERMSTGFKINHAEDNAANYSISTNMSTKLGSYAVAQDNVAMGLDLITTASDSLDLINDKLVRLRALAEQASNGTYGERSLKAINSEANALIDEIERQYQNTDYNGVRLFKNNETQSVSTFSMVRAASAPNNQKFIKAINRIDTTPLTALSKVSTLQSGETYSIRSVADLQKLAELVNNGADTTGMTFVMGNDIDLSGVNWTSIGIMDTDNEANNKHFRGTFDGNGYEIKNLTATTTGNGEGGSIFGLISTKAVIKNLGVTNVDIKGYIAAPLVMSAGDADDPDFSSLSPDKAKIINCYTSGEIDTPNGMAAGMVAFGAVSLESCYSSVDIKNASYAGGLYLGYPLTLSASFKDCYYSGNIINAIDFAGGIVADACGILNMERCYFTGNISAAGGSAGGLVGRCGNTDAGGITWLRLNNCYSSGKISGSGNIGGLIGELSNNASSSPDLSNLYEFNTGADKSLIGKFDDSNLELNNVYVSGSGALDDIVGGTTSAAATVTNLHDNYTGGVPFKLNLVSPTGGNSVNGGDSGSTGDKPSEPAFSPDSIILQVGVTADIHSQIGISTGFSITGVDTLRNIGLDNIDYFTLIDDLLASVSAKQTEYGAAQNRLESALDEISTQTENLTSSRSTLRDADIAEVSSEYIKQQILQQASATLMATANQTPALALQLL